MFSDLKLLSNLRALLKVTYLWAVPPPKRNHFMDVAEGVFFAPLMRSDSAEYIDSSCQDFTASVLLE